MPLTFLCPLDGSEDTDVALRRAIPYMAQLNDAHIRLLVVLDAGFSDIPDEVLEGMDLDLEDHEVFSEIPQAKATIDRATDIAKSAGIHVERRIRRGKPYDVIIEETRLADVLVMHRLDAHQFSERLRGSMTEKIVRHAHCHVLLIETQGQN